MVGRQLSIAVVGGILMVLVLCACEEEPIDVYRVAKTAPPSQVAVAPPVEAAAPAPIVPVWTLPEGWTQSPGTGMRFATLQIEAAQGDRPALEVRVTPLAASASDVAANVRRWADQIGITSLTDQQLAEATQSIEIDGRSATLVDLVGPASPDQPAQRTFAAMLVADATVWFFMITGEDQRVAQHRQALDALVRSIRIKAAPVLATTAAPNITWQRPATWHDDPNPNKLRVASFHIGGDQGQGEVAITQFQGDVGGLLANINRWRKQLGLAGIESIEQQPLAPMEVGGLSSVTMDLHGPHDDQPGSGRRMIVVIVPQPQVTWFIKMVGTDAVVAKEQGTFDAFIQSIRFVEAVDE
jgi:hypothetical protein